MENKYKQKIASLQFQLEEKAREFQKENEKFDSLMDNKKNLIKNITLLKETEASKIDSIESLDAIMEEKKIKSNDILNPKKVEESILKKNIKKLVLISTGLTSKIKLLDKREQQLHTVNRSIDNGQQKLKSINEDIKVADKDLARKQNKDVAITNRLDKREEVIEAKVAKFKKDKKFFNEVKKSYSFYAKRFLRIYKKKNLPIDPKIASLIDNLK